MIVDRRLCQLINASRRAKAEVKRKWRTLTIRWPKRNYVRRGMSSILRICNYGICFCYFVGIYMARVEFVPLGNAAGYNSYPANIENLIAGGLELFL